MDIRFVLVETRYPGNIGAAARAIKTMGFDQLWLVSPRAFPHPEADQRATGAADVLAGATVVDDLDEALEGTVLSFAASARPRTADWPSLDATEAAREAAAASGPVAFVFGPEPSGLSSEAIYRTRYQTFIPAAGDCASLNLSHAVQLYAWEIRRAVPEERPLEPVEPAADDAAMEGLYDEMRRALVAIDFPRRDPQHLMRRFRRIFNRAGLSAREASMLHGLFNIIQKKSKT